tara:strand:+ start:274 stop:663 length:390 start_codon:yes stop_codon:yes gene_type:complete
MTTKELLQNYLLNIIEENNRVDVQLEERPPAASFGAEDLDLTVPEMKPGPYYPGQDIMRDQYILHNPRSGIAYQINNPDLLAASFEIGPESSAQRRNRKLRLRGESGPQSDPEVKAAKQALQGIILPTF